MTTPDPTPAGAAPAASPDEIIGLHRELDRLLIALAAVKMAIDTARDVSFAVRLDETLTEQTTQAWLAANLLVRTAFETLYHEARDTIAVIRLMLPIPQS
jgi:hypothetical protein